MQEHSIRPRAGRGPEARAPHQLRRTRHVPRTSPVAEDAAPGRRSRAGLRTCPKSVRAGAQSLRRRRPVQPVKAGPARLPAALPPPRAQRCRRRHAPPAEASSYSEAKAARLPCISAPGGADPDRRSRPFRVIRPKNPGPVPEARRERALPSSPGTGPGRPAFIQPDRPARDSGRFRAYALAPPIPGPAHAGLRGAT